MTSSEARNIQEEYNSLGGKWEDEEERRFFEDLQDLRELVPKNMLGINESDGTTSDAGSESNKLGTNPEEDGKKENERKSQEEEEAMQLENELKKLQLQELSEDPPITNGGFAVNAAGETVDDDNDDEFV